MKPIAINKSLLSNLRSLIACAKQAVARSVNSAFIILYWQIGRRIRKEILKEKREDYVKQIFSPVS